MTSYIGLIDGKSGAYGVYFPDLPGCVAMGATIDAAVANAAEAMRDWADATEQKGGAIPAPRAIESLCETPTPPKCSAKARFSCELSWCAKQAVR